jgi:hypothetical protein
MVYRLKTNDDVRAFLEFDLDTKWPRHSSVYDTQGRGAISKGATLRYLWYADIQSGGTLAIRLFAVVVTRYLLTPSPTSISTDIEATYPPDAYNLLSWGVISTSTFVFTVYSLHPLPLPGNPTSTRLRYFSLSLLYDLTCMTDRLTRGVSYPVWSRSS